MTDEIRRTLLPLGDRNYRNFYASLIPNIEKDKIIGINTPALRKIAKELAKSENVSSFLSDLPHCYYEENNLHAFIIEQIKDYHVCIKAVNDFLPYIDNWATCDSLNPKCFKKNRQLLLSNIQAWINSERTYTVRFGIKALMQHFLDEDFKENMLLQVASIKSDEYYVNMMISWYMATALAKQWESTVKIIEDRVLPTWIHNKSIQKALESRRITTEQKAYLKKLKLPLK